VMTLLDELASQGHVVILITHDREVAARANRIIEIRDGQIISDSAHSDTHVPVTANSDALQAVDLRQRLADGAEHNGAWKAELLDAV
ncbi:macrolide ABC transporter permease/ATP-binding protein MacB, partial [Salmonella enterica subsp. enterica]